MIASTLALAISPPSSAADAFTVGQRFAKDGLDSRHAAARVADELRAVGYASTGDTDGASANEVWNAGIGAGVIGYFGHANAGVFQVDEGPTPDQNQYIGAGLDSDVVSIDAKARWWSEYLPFVDVDNVRLAILAGCYTSKESPDYGSFMRTGPEKGMDAVVGFQDFVYFPAACTSCNYSGNYFWDRFAVHARSGHGVSTALSLARSDLVAKEGNAGGWDLFRITGSVPAPGNVRVAPGGPGEPLTSRPFGISPFTVSSLHTKSVSSGQSWAGGTTDVSTEEGVFYRKDAATGRLLDVVAPASTAGEVRLDLAAASSAARTFIAGHVAGFGPEWTLESSRTTSHVDGEELASFRWRVRTSDGTAGPALVDVELDRRTGAVTYLVSASASSSAGFQVDRDRARQIAASVVDVTGADVRVAADVWGKARWTVTVNRGLDGYVPDVDTVVIDGVTGSVLYRTTA